MLTDQQPLQNNGTGTTATDLDVADVDEGYWSALLEEGEYTESVQSEAPASNNGWHHAEPHTPSDNFVPNTDYETDPFLSNKDWDLAVKTYENDETINLIITGSNRGGLLVTWRTLRGFVPASQLVDFPIDIDENKRRELLSEKVGEDITLRIIELDVAQNRLIFSERAAQTKPGQRANVLDALAAGDTCEGIVTNLCDFGAFIDLGGVEGLIHISELSWGRVAHPRDVLESGQHVKVHVMLVDADDERIALSLKRLQPDPWATVEGRYQVGEMVEGVITNVVDFGAFACIEDGLEGLIHISELAEGQFLHPRNVVDEGERVRARILNIDGDARRLGLSLRNTPENNDHNESEQKRS